MSTLVANDPFDSVQAAGPGSLGERLQLLIARHETEADALVRRLGEDGAIANTIRLEGRLRGLEQALLLVAAELDGAQEPGGAAR